MDSQPTNRTQEQLKRVFEYYRNGRLGDAEKLAISIIQEVPSNEVAWKALWGILQKTGKTKKSLTAIQKAAELCPSDAKVFYSLGWTLLKNFRLGEAEKALRKAIALKPDYAEAHSNLGNILRELGGLDEAEASYMQAIALKPDYAEAQSNLGVTLRELGRLGEAEASIRQAIALKPDYTEAHYNLGMILKDLGKLDDAKACYIKVLALEPDYAEAHRMLASMKKFDAQDEQYAKMLELYLDNNISDEQRCHINFGLAKAYDDLGDFEKAFTHYEEGNALRKKLLNYDINQDVELFRQIKSAYQQIEQYSLESEKLSRDVKPIFIVGMPRSGTTIVEQIISSHSLVAGAGELPYVAQFGSAIAKGFSKVDGEVLLNFRNKYLAKLKKHSSSKFLVTDKMPQNFRYIGLLAAVFPEAKFIHVKRNPAAVCWANYKQYFASKNLGYCYALDDIVSYHMLYGNLMEFWKNTLKNRIYDLDYESLTINQEDETRQLIDHLDIDWDEKCLSPQNNKREVATASNLQVREKLYQGSSQQWKKFQPFLNGALDVFLSP